MDDALLPQVRRFNRLVAERIGALSDLSRLLRALEADRMVRVQPATHWLEKTLVGRR